MTRKKVTPSRQPDAHRSRDTRKRSPLVERHTDDQVARIAKVLSEWLDDAPGRSVTLSRTERGWAARLNDERNSTGSTPVDALAQIATSVIFEAAR